MRVQDLAGWVLLKAIIDGVSKAPVAWDLEPERLLFNRCRSAVESGDIQIEIDAGFTWSGQGELIDIPADVVRFFADELLLEFVQGCRDNGVDPAGLVCEWGNYAVADVTGYAVNVSMVNEDLGWSSLDDGQIVEFLAWAKAQGGAS